jgi:uncharacterized protein YndB with AHSA1/START domain
MAEQELYVEREFAATAAEVFDGFLGMYGEPRPEWIVDSKLDLRVGGTWDVVFHPPGVGEFREHRVLTVIDRPHRLSYTVTVLGDAPEFDTQVAIVIEPSDDSRTFLSLTQSGFPDAASRDDFAGAWPDVLALLAGRIADRD